MLRFSYRHTTDSALAASVIFIVVLAINVAGYAAAVMGLLHVIHAEHPSVPALGFVTIAAVLLIISFVGAHITHAVVGS